MLPHLFFLHLVEAVDRLLQPQPQRLTLLQFFLNLKWNLILILLYLSLNLK